MKKQTLAKEFKDYETLWDNTGNIIKEDTKLTDDSFGSDVILSEWVDAKGNKTTLSNNTNTSTKSLSSYKKRFENLINYHLDHVSSNWDYLVKQEINNNGFILSEVYNTGEPFLRTIIVSVDNSNTFHLRVKTEGKNDYYRKHPCYEDLLKDLAYDMHLPTAGTTEYKNLLKEWVDHSGNRINLNNRSTSPASKSAASNSASATSGDVYAWSVYVRGSTTYSKGGWLSAEYFNGQLEGAVFSTPELAEDYAWDHLKELEAEGELYDEGEEVELDADFFTIETIAYPKADMNANVDLIEFIDNGGQKVVLNSNSAAPKAPTQKTSTTNNSAATGPTKIYDLRAKYDKLVSHLRTMYSLNVNRKTAQLLDVTIKVGTKFKNKLIVTYDYQKDCLIGALYDEFDREVSSNNCWGGWSALIAWLKKAGFPLIDHLCESKLNESCKFNFTKEDLDAALDNLSEENEPGLEFGTNFEDADVMRVAGEPYGGTKWYVDKWADNLYIITSELWGQDGGGPEEGVYEEFDSIDEVWNYLSKLDQLDSVPALGPKKPESLDYSTSLTEYVDAKGTKITSSGHSSGWSLYSINSPEVCEGCGQIVEFNPNLKNTQMFFEPFQLKNGHKLCSDCMEVWISLPKGFVDKMNIVSQYEIMAGDIDEFVENLKLTQQDIDSMIQEWNNKKKQGLITLQPQEIGSIETYFVEAVQKLGLKATKADFV